MTIGSQTAADRAAGSLKREPKKLSYFPVLKETTRTEYRTGKAVREQISMPDPDKQNKKSTQIYIVYELMKQKISCTITLRHNPHQKLFEVENLGLLRTFKIWLCWECWAK